MFRQILVDSAISMDAAITEKIAAEARQPTVLHVDCVSKWELSHRYSSWILLIRITIYVRQFMRNLKRQIQQELSGIIEGTSASCSIGNEQLLSNSYCKNTGHEIEECNRTCQCNNSRNNFSENWRKPSSGRTSSGPEPIHELSVNVIEIREMEPEEENAESQ